MSNNKQPNQVARPSGIITTAITIVFNLTLISLSAWIILLFIYSVMILLKGHVETFTYLQNMINNDLNLIESNKSLLILHMINHLYSFHALMSQFLSTLPNKIAQCAAMLFMDVSEICVTRLMIFIIVLPFFCLLLLVAITDGLVKRDIRKYQGARESTFTFHRSKHLFWFCLFVPFFIYMSLPYSISSSLFLSAQAVLLSYIAWISISNFKKYI